MTKTDVDALIGEYLQRLDVALDKMPNGPRQQLVAEITEHLNEARSRLSSPSEAAIRDLLDRVGRPEDIAAEAMADQPAGDTRPSTSRLRLGLIGAFVVIVLAAALALALTSRGRGQIPSPPTTSGPVPLVTMPGVVGQPRTVASAQLLSLGLTVRVTEAPSTIAPPGLVFSQAPGEGARVAFGSVVLLTVSSGPPGLAGP